MQINARATMTVGATNGAITDQAVADAAMRSVAGMPKGVPLDVHVVGDVRFISPCAFGAVGDLLLRAREITVYAPGNVVSDITAAIGHAVDEEKRRLERSAQPDPVLAAEYDAVARSERRGGDR
ncbi:hypothetical protein [Streptomonospora salina]|uniref:Uncharacterized protein n=1 Tax=Streptomonospora salina TaxID=104205 RepID=A0A841EET4_9ACTN|nr:hypothetical protein [Streptomonospora salina]MBB6000854.1 hypothetical protein [Streptomonospora salina]